MAVRNSLRIDGDVLTVIPRGLDRIWSFRSKITVPLSAISDVSIETRPQSVKKGWRGPGLDTFIKLSGTFHPGGERHFWNYSGHDPALSIRLDDSQHFDQLYLSVADTRAWQERLSAAAAAVTSRRSDV